MINVRLVGFSGSATKREPHGRNRINRLFGFYVPSLPAPSGNPVGKRLRISLAFACIFPCSCTWMHRQWTTRSQQPRDPRSKLVLTTQVVDSQHAVSHEAGVFEENAGFYEGINCSCARGLRENQDRHAAPEAYGVDRAG
jgi:hypothetical protein